MASSGRKRINAKKPPSREDKLRRLDSMGSEFPDDAKSVEFCYTHFKIAQMEKGNNKQTIAFNDRFYKKLCSYLMTVHQTTPSQVPIDFMVMPASQLAFQTSLGDVNQQTINAYLRGWRAFGNFCEELGYLDGFKCSIKEVPAEVKQVYTEKELNRLLVKPNLADFEAFRNFTIINLLLATGARTNIILNILIQDVYLEEALLDFI